MTKWQYSYITWFEVSRDLLIVFWLVSCHTAVTKRIVCLLSFVLFICRLPNEITNVVMIYKMYLYRMCLFQYSQSVCYLYCIYKLHCCLLWSSCGGNSCKLTITRSVPPSRTMFCWIINCCAKYTYCWLKPAVILIMLDASVCM